MNEITLLVAITLFGSGGSPPAIPESIADWIEGCRSGSFARWQTEIEVEHFSPVPIVDAEAAWEKSSHSLRERLKFRYVDGWESVAVGQAPTWPSDGLGQTEFYSFCTADGWVELLTERKRARILRTRPLDERFDCVAFLNLVDRPSLGAGLLISEAFALLPIDTQKVDEDTYCVAFMIDESSRVEYKFQTRPEVRLVSVQTETFIPAGRYRAGEVNWRIQFHIDKWVEVNGVAIPQIAYRDVYVLIDDALEAQGTGPIAVRTSFRRISSQPLSDDERALSHYRLLELDGRWHVVDERANIQYDVGTGDVMIDGFLLRLDEPLVGDPLLMLPKIVGEVPNVVPIAIQDIPTYIPVLRPRVYWSIGAGLSVFASSLLFMALNRRLRGRS